MLGLPKSTVVDINLPKKKFYENLTVSSKLKRHFIDEIDGIRWQNKIAPETMNVSAGENVKEIEVIEIRLSGESIDESVLTQIDREIPYHILYVLTKGDQARLCIGYKETAQSGNNAFKVSRYFYTEYADKDRLIIIVDSSDLDSVYDKFVRFIAGNELSDFETLSSNIEQIEERKRIQKQINILNKQIKKEKQFNRQMDMINELRLLQKELDNVN